MHQSQANTGNNALAEQGGSGSGSGKGKGGGGNTANQGIGQSQTPLTKTHNVSGGGNVADSCNNTRTKTKQIAEVMQ